MKAKGWLQVVLGGIVLLVGTFVMQAPSQREPVVYMTATVPFNYFLTIIGQDSAVSSPTPTITLTPTPSPPPTITPTPTATPFPTTLPPPTPLSGLPPLDFPAIRTQLEAEGQALAFNKIGFHTGPGGNPTGIGDFMTTLDTAGVPFFMKSVDDAGILYQAQQLIQASGVPHILVWRRSGGSYDVPNYSLPPAQAAANHWQLHKDAFPPELDPSLIWIETINEVDKNRSEWLAAFALETAQLAIADGFKWAAFGWSSGEPEPSHWQGEQMLEFLEYAGNHPQQVAIALHEYSFDITNVGQGYPYLLGRFQALFDACDQNQIERPTVLITEWGWEAFDVPTPSIALVQLEWAAWLYAAYPEVEGAAIWYLGGGFGGIADQAQQLIAPVKDYSLSHYFSYTPGVGVVDGSVFEPPTFPRQE